MAVTDCAALKVMVQLAVPVQAPVHPANAKLVPGVSLSVTCVFWAKLAEHVVGQLIPEGLLTMVPDPVPARVTVNATLVPGTGWGEGDVPMLPPPQPERRQSRADKDRDVRVFRDRMP